MRRNELDCVKLAEHFMFALRNPRLWEMPHCNPYKRDTMGEVNTVYTHVGGADSKIHFRHWQITVPKLQYIMPQVEAGWSHE